MSACYYENKITLWPSVRAPVYLLQRVGYLQAPREKMDRRGQHVVLRNVHKAAIFAASTNFANEETRGMYRHLRIQRVTGGRA